MFVKDAFGLGENPKQSAGKNQKTLVDQGFLMASAANLDAAFLFYFSCFFDMRADDL